MTVESEPSAAVFRWLARREALRVLLWGLGAGALLGALKTRGPSQPGPTYNIYNITDAEYHAMPQLYELDEYYGCLVRGGVYCFGRFELEAPPENELFQKIQKYSEDWVRHSNHSCVHRGVCLPRRCPRRNPKLDDHEWFASCVSSTIASEYNMSARLKQLDYCTRELQGNRLTAGGAAFIGLLTVLLIIATISTVLDLKLSDESKKDICWALSWSVRRSWRTLKEPVQSADTDLRFLDGLRAVAMGIIIFMHTAGFAVVVNVTDTRFYEQNPLALVNGNLPLVVQIFFIVSSFLMARKILQQDDIPAKKNFVQTLQNRVVRILPSYMVLILYMVSLHEYCGSGPMWHHAVRAERDTCRRVWWMHVLFVNNFNTGPKCLGQTWYLAADMQLYIAGLLLTLLLRGRRALLVLAALLATIAILYICIAYAWNLMPLYAIHIPDNFYREYSGVATFDLLYQSPWGNAFASLTGLLLAHAERSLKMSEYDLHKNQVYRWVARLAAPSLLVWVVLWPCIHPLGPPTRLRSALLAGLIGPVFCVLVAVIIMDMLQGEKTPLRTFLSSRAFGVRARLSMSVLLVHFPLARVQLVLRDSPVNIDYLKLIFNTFGVWATSYTTAAALALLVELPAQRLYRELSGASRVRDKRGKSVWTVGSRTSEVTSNRGRSSPGQGGRLASVADGSGTSGVTSQCGRSSSGQGGRLVSVAGRIWDKRGD